MANSTTTKKSSIDKVKSFVQSKLETAPVIVNNDDFVRVGKYICRQHSGLWTVFLKGTKIESFVLRSSAVAWCVAMITDQSAKASSILRQDLHYSRVAEDAYIYKARLKSSKDNFKKELMWIRYEDSKYQLSCVRNRLNDFLKNINFS